MFFITCVFSRIKNGSQQSLSDMSVNTVFQMRSCHFSVLTKGSPLPIDR